MLQDLRFPVMTELLGIMDRMSQLEAAAQPAHAEAVQARQEAAQLMAAHQAGQQAAGGN